MRWISACEMQQQITQNEILSFHFLRKNGNKTFEIYALDILSPKNKIVEKDC